MFKKKPNNDLDSIRWDAHNLMREAMELMLSSSDINVSKEANQIMWEMASVIVECDRMR